MADGEESGSLPLLNNAIFQEIDGGIAHILNDLGTQPCAEVIEQLALNVDKDVLLDIRYKVFKVAVQHFEQELEARGVSGGKPKLELIQRKGDLVNEKLAKDIVDTVKYVCKLTEIFPKDLLSTNSKRKNADSRD